MMRTILGYGLPVGVLIASMILSASSLVCGESCRMTPLTGAEIANLQLFVQSYFQTPFSVSLKPEDIRQMPAACAFELTFRPTEPHMPVELAFQLTSDHRFLARELIDTKMPIETARRAINGSLWSALSRGSMPVRGDKEVSTLVVEFSDFACPFAKEMSEWLKREAVSKHLRVGFRYLPITKPQSRQLAEVAACAFMQGDSTFWRVHDALFLRQEELVGGTISADEVASRIPEVDQEVLTACIGSRAASFLIDRDLTLARQNGFSATPTIVMPGRTLRGPSTIQVQEAIDNARR